MRKANPDNKIRLETKQEGSEQNKLTKHKGRLFIKKTNYGGKTGQAQVKLMKVVKEEGNGDKGRK